MDIWGEPAGGWSVSLPFKEMKSIKNNKDAVSACISPQRGEARAGSSSEGASPCLCSEDGRLATCVPVLPRLSGSPFAGTEHAGGTAHPLSALKAVLEAPPPAELDLSKASSRMAPGPGTGSHRGDTAPSTREDAPATSTAPQTEAAACKSLPSRKLMCVGGRAGMGGVQE